MGEAKTLKTAVFRSSLRAPGNTGSQTYLLVLHLFPAFITLTLDVILLVHELYFILQFLTSGFFDSDVVGGPTSQRPQVSNRTTGSADLVDNRLALGDWVHRLRIHGARDSQWNQLASAFGLLVG